MKWFRTMYPIVGTASYNTLSGERPDDDELVNQLEEAALHNDFDHI